MKVGDLLWMKKDSHFTTVYHKDNKGNWSNLPDIPINNLNPRELLFVGKGTPVLLIEMCEPGYPGYGLFLVGEKVVGFIIERFL